MISFLEKKILITQADSNLGKKLALKLNNLGAKLVLIGENEIILKEIISITSSKHTYLRIKIDEFENIDTLISNHIKSATTKFDGYIHCSTFLPKYFTSNAHFYIKMIGTICKDDYSNDNMSILLISDNSKNSITDINLSCIASNYSINNLSKIISLKYIHRKARVNTVIIDHVKINIDEENYINNISNVGIYLMSDSAKYIIGEEYIIDN